MEENKTQCFRILGEDRVGAVLRSSQQSEADRKTNDLYNKIQGPFQMHKKERISVRNLHTKGPIAARAARAAETLTSDIRKL